MRSSPDPAAGSAASASSRTYRSWCTQDNNGGSATGAVSLFVNAPPIVQAESFKGQENHTITGNLMGGASDPDGDTVSAVAGTFATVVSSLTPTEALFIHRPMGWLARPPLRPPLPLGIRPPAAAAALVIGSSVSNRLLAVTSPLDKQSGA